MKLSESFKSGVFFGLTSGVITTVGLMVGLAASTNSRFVVIGGLITIAISDALSDAMGMHLSQESDHKNTPKDIWSVTLSTFLTKFLFALSFVFPVIFLDLFSAVIVSVVWGVIVLSVASYFIAKRKGEGAREIILEHFFLAVAVVLISYEIGVLVAKYFN